MSVLRKLLADVDRLVEVRDDQVAKAMLFELGLLDKLGMPGNRGSYFQTIFHADHATHWIMGIRFTGFEQAKDNGYLVVCLPRSHFGAMEADRFVAEWRHRQGGEIESWAFFHSDSRQN